MTLDPTNYYEIWNDCECMEAKKVIAALKSSKLDKLIRKCTFAKFDADTVFQKQVKKLALEFLDDYQENWFYFGGQSGCGKTHICTAILVNLITKKKLGGKYMRWREEIIKLKACRNNDEAYYTALFPYTTTPVLYIDDLFKGRNDDFFEGKDDKPRGITDADVGIAFDIIDYRYNKSMTTIISSEFRIKDLLEVDEAIASRIVEMAGRYSTNIGKNSEYNHRLNKQKHLQVE